MYQKMKKVEIEKLLKKYEASMLFFSSQGEKHAWRNLVVKSPRFQPMLNEIKAEANRLLDTSSQELSFSLFNIYYETGSRLEYEQAYFEKRRRLNTFAILTILEPNESKHQEQLQNSIWSICNEYTWCLPAHYSADQVKSDKETIDLFAAETAFALSEILHLTKEALNPLIQQRISKEINRRIIRPFLTQEPFFWETATHNWAAVCAGSVGAASLYLINDLEELAAILERVLAALESYLSGFYDDGTCLEGYGYWEYGFGFYVYFADLLRKRTNGEIDLFKSEKVHQIALFQQKIFLNKNCVANFSDAIPATNINLGLSQYLSELYPDFELPESELRAQFTADHCSRWAPAFRQLYWYPAQYEGKPWKSRTYYLKNAQWFISRHNCKNNHYAFAAKGGNNDEPHNHNDIGQFILLADDEVFLQDLGSGLYNNEYFGKNRYSFLCTGSHGHSVPIINGGFQQAGKSFKADILNVQIEEKNENFTLDMKHAYDQSELKQLTRSFTWIKTARPKLILQDSYIFHSTPSSVIERFITPCSNITKTKDAIMLHGEHNLQIKYDANRLQLKIKKMEFYNHFGNKEYAYGLDFHVMKLTKTLDFQFIFQFC